jgi:hypothetical protein
MNGSSASAVADQLPILLQSTPHLPILGFLTAGVRLTASVVPEKAVTSLPGYWIGGVELFLAD